MTKSSIDKLGDSLRAGLTRANLEQLDEYRRSFLPAYSAVVAKIEELLKVEISGRPAKSNISIQEKLMRSSSMRLSQMIDIAGCRIVVEDVDKQLSFVAKLTKAFYPDVRLIDRGEKPSYGYRAFHLIVKIDGYSVEVQIRTALQQSWAELSEKMADLFGSEIKYGGNAAMQKYLVGLSDILYKMDILMLDKDNTKEQLVEELGNLNKQLVTLVADFVPFIECLRKERKKLQ